MELTNEIISEYEGLITKMAKQFIGGSEIEDAVQEGYLGLMRACESYNPNKQTAFHNWAIINIKGYLKNYKARCYEKVARPSRNLYLAAKALKEGNHEQIKKYLQKEKLTDKDLNKLERLRDMIFYPGIEYDDEQFDNGFDELDLATIIDAKNLIEKNFDEKDRYIIFKMLAGYSQTDISVDLGITKQAVGQRLKRIYKRLESIVG